LDIARSALSSAVSSVQEIGLAFRSGKQWRERMRDHVSQSD
jgi:hypothetical protein